MSKISVELHHPNYLIPEDYLGLQKIAHDAYGSTLLNHDGSELSEGQLTALVGLDDPERFRQARLAPSSEVGKSKRDNQDLRDPLVALAYVDDELAGWGYSHVNVSGNKLEQNLKRLFSPGHIFFVIQEVLVLPTYQRQGVATEIVKAQLSEQVSMRHDRRKISYYDWPSLQPNWLNDKIAEVGFIITDNDPKQIFGPDSEKVIQARHENPSIQGLLGKLAK